MNINWVIESFGVVTLDADDEYIVCNLDKYHGSFDWLGSEGYDNFVFDRQTKEIALIGLGIPQNFKIRDGFRQISLRLGAEVSLDTFITDLLQQPEEVVFNSLSYSIFDATNDTLICLSEDSVKEYDFVKINDVLSLLLTDQKYNGFFLSKATTCIRNFNEAVVDPKFKDVLKELLLLVNEESYSKMEDFKDEKLFSILNKIKLSAQALNDSRKEEIINCVNNCLDAFYDIW